MSIQPTDASASTAPVEASKLTDSAMEEISASESPAATPVAEIAPIVAAPNPELDRQAAKFAALSRQDKALKARERELARKEKEYEAKLATSGTVDNTKYIDIEGFKKNPYKYMKDHGLTLEEVANIALNDGKITPEKLVEQSESKLQTEIRELREKMAAKEAREEEQRVESIVQSFKHNLGKFVADTPEYEMIRSQDAEGVQLVYDVMDAHYNEQLAAYTEENGEEPSAEERQSFILDNKRACDMVEAWLLDQEKARITKLKAMNKTKGMFEPTAKPVEQKSKVPQSPTLTNTLSAQVPSKDSKTLTDDESKREAAKLIKFLD